MTFVTETVQDIELKGRHRAMWASGDYSRLVDAFLLPLGPRLVEACGVVAGQLVLDVAAGTGNASIPAAQRGATVTASDLTPELLEAGRQRPEADGLDLTWVSCDAEDLVFPDASFDIVMSSIGVMFAPHHQAAADELARVCRPAGTIATISWTPAGMIGSLFATMKEFGPPPPAGALPPPMWGDPAHVADLFGDRVAWHTSCTESLTVTCFESARDFGEHFKAYYGPAIGVRANAVRNGVAADFDAAIDAFSERWDIGEPGAARFKLEYLLSVGTRT